MTTAFALLGSTTLGSPASSISLSSLPARKYVIIEIYESPSSGSSLGEITFNSDTGANYARRSSNNGGTDVTNASQTYIEDYATTTANPKYCRYFVINISAQEKLCIGHSIEQGTAGAANAPSRDEYVYKWANTSAQITTITLTASTGNFATGSIMSVYGSD